MIFGLKCCLINFFIFTITRGIRVLQLAEIIRFLLSNKVLQLVQALILPDLDQVLFEFLQYIAGVGACRDDCILGVDVRSNNEIKLFHTEYSLVMKPCYNILVKCLRAEGSYKQWVKSLFN